MSREGKLTVGCLDGRGIVSITEAELMLRCPPGFFPDISFLAMYFVKGSFLFVAEFQQWEFSCN